VQLPGGTPGGAARQPVLRPVPGPVGLRTTQFSLAYREALTLAFADAFRVIMIAFVVATALVPLLRQVAPAKAPTGSH